MHWRAVKLHSYIRVKVENKSESHTFHGQIIPSRIFLGFGDEFSPYNHQKSLWLFGVGIKAPCSGATGYCWEGMGWGSRETSTVPSCHLPDGKKGWNLGKKYPNFPVLAVNIKMEEWLSDYKLINFSASPVQQRLFLMNALKNSSFFSYIQVIYYQFFFNCGVLDINWTEKFWSIYEFQKTPVEENIF